MKLFTLGNSIELELLLTDHLKLASGKSLFEHNIVSESVAKSVRFVLESNMGVDQKILTIGLLLITFDKIVIKQVGEYVDVLNLGIKRGDNRILTYSITTDNFYFYTGSE